MSFAKPRLLFASLAALLALGLLSSGCASLRKKKRAEDKSIPVATEQMLKERWVEQRSAELAQRGISPQAARRQAQDEFRQKYPFIEPAR